MSLIAKFTSASIVSHLTRKGVDLLQIQRQVSPLQHPAFTNINKLVSLRPTVSKSHLFIGLQRFLADILAVGSYAPYNAKAELLLTDRDSWVTVADYPYDEE